MIINNRSDLDNAPQSERDAFMLRLAASINQWDWQNGEWEMVQDIGTIERYEFTVADFPDAPVPDKPNYNPDEVEAQRKIEEAKANRKAAYEQEADPLFFKSQRGETTEQEWLDKIAEIKARFPKE